MEILEDASDKIDFVYGFVITGPVMAFAKVSATHKDAVRSVYKTVHQKDRVYSARAHQPDDADIGRILETSHPCRISRCITAPVAQKAKDPRFEFVTCHFQFVEWLSS